MDKKSRVQFVLQRKRALEGADLSRKGSIDEPVKGLVQYINTKSFIFTTSSCSGRIIIVGQNTKTSYDGAEQVLKKGCKWVYVTHQLADLSELMAAISREENKELTLKFDPFILHVSCMDTEVSRELLACAIASGYKNSGISLSKSGKIIVAVRSTSSLEVPLGSHDALLVSPEHLEFLVNKANDKMRSNLLQIGRLFENIKSRFEEYAVPS